MAPRPTELRERTTGKLAIAGEVDIVNSAGDGEDDIFKKKKLIGIDGKWYNVTNFIKYHPGGPIIEKFVGQDATAAFRSTGHENHGVLDKWKPVGTYTMPQRHPADAEFEQMIKDMKAEGLYETDYSFYVKKFSFIASLWATVFLCVMAFDAWYMHYLGAVVLAFVWQQSGFVMHEFMHSQVVKKHEKDRYGGVFFGTVIFGISAHWWRDEHIFHHAMTNSIDIANRFVDPQMWESVWAQDPKMFPLFKNSIQWFFIKIQHITFIPFVCLIGRLEIVFDSFIKEKRLLEWIGWSLHWVWITYLLSHLPTWREVAIFYAIAASIEGIFHFQLILSHYCKAYMYVDEYHKTSWYVYQIITNMNLLTPKWQDWYYGGLNYHIEHHLFPTLPRKHLRAIGPRVQAICKKHGIDYDICPFTEALWKTLVSLKEAGSHFSLDPR